VDEERRRWNLSGAEAHMIFSFSGSGAGDKESFVSIFYYYQCEHHELELAVWAHTIFFNNSYPFVSKIFHQAFNL
jgi:hypothetical protein